MIKKISDFSFINRIIFKLIHKLQKYSLNNGYYKLYISLFKLHFSRYFDLDLRTEVIAKSYSGKAAMRRHARIVIKVIYNNQSPDNKEIMYQASKPAFRDAFLIGLYK